jgi:rSAM/selenodomain-associated transferase 2
LISVILPVLNEAAGIRTALAALQPLRTAGHEIILVDGGSHDGTPALAYGLVDVCMNASRGRARQMNAGARIARGSILLFLHADTLLPEGAANMIIEGLATPGVHWGRFNVRISGGSAWFPLISFMINLRSRITGIATGDQALFVITDLFYKSNGYADIALMEDIDLCVRLKRHSRPLCIPVRVTTSGRRWEKHGVWRTIFLMWWLRLRYFLGDSPDLLAGSYDPDERP